ncbi:MAG: sulfotransferase [Pseudomonadota bacterium]
MASLSEQRRSIANLYRNHSYLHAAEAAHRYLEQVPEDEEILEVLGDSALQCGHIDVGEKVLDLLVARKRTPSRLTCLSIARSARGDIAGATKLLREALTIDPTDSGAWASVMSSHRFKKNDPLIAKAKRILKRDDVPRTSRRTIHYALCKAMNDLGKWDHAWDHASKGAALAETDYKGGHFQKWLAEAESTFDREFLAERQGRGLVTTAPIFIVGMPRSGTTLMEIILAATGEVTPLGEMTAIPDASARAVAQDAALGNPEHSHTWVHRWRDDAFTRLGTYYLDVIAQRTNRAVPEKFTDKLPGNALFLGQIGLIFPRAKVIIMHRDPLDTCVSCYMGQFRSGHDYTYRLDWLAEAAHGFQQIGNTLAGMIPNPVLHVCYEDLVSRPEPEIKRVLEFVGAAWTPDCLAPEPIGYTTTTRSVAQVREPINARSVGRWRRYANRIGPLADALGINLAQSA